MKIGSLDTRAVPAPATTDRKASPATGGAGTAEPSAKVELSTAALQGVASDGSFDAEKVQRIAQAIRDGQFRVNPEAIADKLIANAAELLGRGPAQ